MPKLLFFVPCERAIVDDIGKQVSMISVLESLNVNLGEKIPEDAGLPLPWMTLSFWRRIEGEEDKNFEERLQVISPNGEVYAEDVVAFNMHKLNHRVRHTIIGIRVGIAGDTLVRLSVRAKDNNEEWRQVAEFPIHVRHLPSETPGNEVSGEESGIENAEVG